MYGFPRITDENHSSVGLVKKYVNEMLFIPVVNCGSVTAGDFPPIPRSNNYLLIYDLESRYVSGGLFFSSPSLLDIPGHSPEVYYNLTIFIDVGCIVVPQNFFTGGGASPQRAFHKEIYAPTHGEKSPSIRRIKVPSHDIFFPGLTSAYCCPPPPAGAHGGVGSRAPLP